MGSVCCFHFIDSFLSTDAVCCRLQQKILKHIFIFLGTGSFNIALRPFIIISEFIIIIFAAGMILWQTPGLR